MLYYNTIKDTVEAMKILTSMTRHKMSWSRGLAQSQGNDWDFFKKSIKDKIKGNRITSNVLYTTFTKVTFYKRGLNMSLRSAPNLTASHAFNSGY